MDSPRTASRRSRSMPTEWPRRAWPTSSRGAASTGRSSPESAGKNPITVVSPAPNCTRTAPRPPRSSGRRSTVCTGTSSRPRVTAPNSTATRSSRTRSARCSSSHRRGPTTAPTRPVTARPTSSISTTPRSARPATCAQPVGTCAPTPGRSPACWPTTTPTSTSLRCLRWPMRTAAVFRSPAFRSVSPRRPAQARRHRLHPAGQPGRSDGGRHEEAHNRDQAETGGVHVDGHEADVRHDLGDEQ